MDISFLIFITLLGLSALFYLAIFLIDVGIFFHEWFCKIKNYYRISRSKFCGLKSIRHELGEWQYVNSKSCLLERKCKHCGKVIDSEKRHEWSQTKCSKCGACRQCDGIGGSIINRGYYTEHGCGGLGSDICCPGCSQCSDPYVYETCSKCNGTGYIDN
ncbi:MAG: hypothetical protein HY885_08335 [Deltaproteobacteria bacterium]|jgi:hypothetical protein|nr:hypothetical protein [Deltaproteobacteria bacterium]